jgi:squalene cyclase
MHRLTAVCIRGASYLTSFLPQGYNGSQLWDTAFAVQALAATQLGDQLGDTLAKAGSFIEATQVWSY